MLVFADAGAIPAAAVYRRELTIVGSRSAAPQLHARSRRAARRASAPRADRAATRSLRRRTRAVPPPRRPQGRLHPLTCSGRADARSSSRSESTRGSPRRSRAPGATRSRRSGSPASGSCAASAEHDRGYVEHDADEIGELPAGRWLAIQERGFAPTRRRCGRRPRRRAARTTARLLGARRRGPRRVLAAMDARAPGTRPRRGRLRRRRARGGPDHGSLRPHLVRLLPRGAGLGLGRRRRSRRSQDGSAVCARRPRRRDARAVAARRGTRSTGTRLKRSPRSGTRTTSSPSPRRSSSQPAGAVA